ncbi:MAG: hypothetical protein ThorAB25_22300 [Candidatus Thorarchaeota archaeon AB_25]|nr:MAG: hypothetical protein ThorAB25_22300 [Candidatus Thorarchaeota archaeon AB_25]
MPKCPYCSEELRIKLAGVFVDQIDDEYWPRIETFVQQLPRVSRIAFKSRVGRVKDHVEREHPLFVNLLVCSYCDSVLSAEVQKMVPSL